MRVLFFSLNFFKYIFFNVKTCRPSLRIFAGIPNANDNHLDPKICIGIFAFYLNLLIYSNGLNFVHFSISFGFFLLFYFSFRLFRQTVMRVGELAVYSSSLLFWSNSIVLMRSWAHINVQTHIVSLSSRCHCRRRRLRRRHINICSTYFSRIFSCRARAIVPCVCAQSGVSAVAHYLFRYFNYVTCFAYTEFNIYKLKRRQ